MHLMIKNDYAGFLLTIASTGYKIKSVIIDTKYSVNIEFREWLGVESLIAVLLAYWLYLHAFMIYKVIDQPWEQIFTPYHKTDVLTPTKTRNTDDTYCGEEAPTGMCKHCQWPGLRLITNGLTWKYYEAMVYICLTSFSLNFTKTLKVSSNIWSFILK